MVLHSISGIFRCRTTLGGTGDLTTCRNARNACDLVGVVEALGGASLVVACVLADCRMACVLA
jgi:hypothetical protein